MSNFIFYLVLTIVIVLVFFATFISLNSARNIRNNPELEIEDFISMLRRKGFNDELIDLCLKMIMKLQMDKGSEDVAIIDNRVMRALNGWDYSEVVSEEEFYSAYQNNKKIIDRIHEDKMTEIGFVPSSFGEARHTEHWSEEAQHCEFVITQTISDVIQIHKNRY